MSKIEITPNDAQYWKLVDDLQILREAGAASNTQAILDAVRRAAEYDQRDNVNGRAASRVLPARQQEDP